MKNLLNIFTFLIKPLYGSGIGNYPPFKQIYFFYEKILNKNVGINQTNYGFNMILNGSKLIDKEIIFTGYWEKNVSELIKNELKEGDTFIDIGANIGYFTLLGSKIVGKYGKVISFEPSILNYNILEKNIELNNFENIEKYKLGAGNTESEFEIYYNNENPGATSLVKTKDNYSFNKELIKIIKLDDFLGNIKIDFIKMDIEGYEFDAILGMENILKNNDLKMIFEYSPRIYKEKEVNFKEYSINLLNKLNNLSFDLFHINIDGSLRKIINNGDYYLEVSDNKIGQTDIICIKRK